MINLRSFVLTATVLMAATANGAVVFSDNFDAETPGLGKNTLINFSVDAPNVDVIPDMGNYDFYPGNGFYLDLDGSNNAAGTNATIRTNAVFGPGSYVLSFALGNNPGGGSSINTLTVSLGDFLQAFNTTTPMALTPQNIAFTTTVAGQLVFSQGGPVDQQGSILDDVQLSTGAVPEPASVVTMLTGIAAIGLTQWKRSRRK